MEDSFLNDELSPQEVQEEDEDFNDAIAEFNALTVKFQATREQYKKWKSHFSAERHRLIDSLRLALYQFDKEQVQRKKVSSPPKMPARLFAAVASNQPEPTEPSEVAESPEPEDEDEEPVPDAESTAEAAVEALANNISHKRIPVDRTKSDNQLRVNMNFTAAHRTSVAPLLSTQSDEAVEALKDDETGRTKLTRTWSDMQPKRGQHAAVQRSASLGVEHQPSATGLRTAGSKTTLEDLAETEDDLERRPRAATARSGVDQLDAEEIRPSTSDSSLRAVHDIRIAVPRPVRRMRPQLMVRGAESASQRKSPLKKFVHRANAMDLEEMRANAERTFRRLNSTSYYQK